MNAFAETAKMIKIVTSMECFVTRHLNQVWDNVVSDVPCKRSGRSGVDVESTKSVRKYNHKCLELPEWDPEFVNPQGRPF